MDENKINTKANATDNLNKIRNVEDAGLTMPKPEPTPEEKVGNLANTLHKGGILPQLRTYQGDVAEFIKSKDQSIAGVALKRQEKRQEEKKETTLVAKTSITEEPAKDPSKNISTNFLIYIISIVLIVGAVTAGSYILFIKQNDAPTEVISVGGLLRSDDTVFVNLSTLDKKSLASNLDDLRNKGGNESKNINVLEVKIGDSIGNKIETPARFIQTMGLAMPGALLRSLGSEMSFGLWQGREMFLIFQTKDFGIAWGGMLEWENSLANDFGPLLASSTTTATYTWKDIIVKNKDARGAIDEFGNTAIIYTFIDKNTILITESNEALRAVLDKFVEGNTIK